MNVADYWRRWHISLTSWLTDYVFTPLNIRFRDWGKMGIILAIIINMVVVGLWHGANWTFAVFGLYHGLLFVPLILSGAFMKKAKLKTNRLGLPVLKDFGKMLLTFMLVTVGLIIFRAESIEQAWEYVCEMCNESLYTVPWLINREYYIPVFISVIVLLVIEWATKSKCHSFAINELKLNKWIRRLSYIVIALLTIWWGSFVYNQFHCCPVKTD